MYSGRFLWISCVGLLMLLGGWRDAAAQSKINVEDLLRTQVKAVPEDSPANSGAKDPLKVRRGQVVKIILTGTPANGYHTYPLTKRSSSQGLGFMSRWTIEETKGIVSLWPVIETEPILHFDKNLGKKLLEHFNTFEWQQPIQVASDAPIGKLVVRTKLKTQVCNDGGCWPIKREDEITLDVSDEKGQDSSAISNERLKKPELSVVPVPGEEPVNVPAESPIIEKGLIKDSYSEYKAKIAAIAAQIVHNNNDSDSGSSGLLQFLLAGIFWGAISLVTPCVFPMIPITVSFFLKQSEKENYRPIVMAAVYSLTIVIVLTIAAASLITTFSILSTRPWMNYIIGGLFIFFSLSLFGMYEIELPSSLAQFTAAREGTGGSMGTIFMALTFTIISFACVAPFLGGFSGTAASERPLWHNLLGALAFSATFASPFFVLALFPALLRKMPKSGSWLNSVKVVMGFLELAAALKFFRNAELIQTKGASSFFTFDLILGIWVALSVLCGLYLLGLFRLPHDTPEDHVSVPRLLFSGAFLALAIYLTPALFKVNAEGQSQRPAGIVYSWIDAFLLPDTKTGQNELIHTGNLDYAVSVAREELRNTGKPKRIFIDFTGVNCSNCSKNERDVFIKTPIAKLFEPYLIVKMYLDVVPEYYYAPNIRAEFANGSTRATDDAEEVNLGFEKDKFGTVQRPLYVILEPDLNNRIRVVGVYPEGLINDQAAFAKFLTNPEAP